MPSAIIELGFRCTVTVAGKPTVWVRTCVAGTVPSVAVIVGVPTVVELVIVAVYVPLPVFVVALIFWPGSLEVKTTAVSAGRGCAWLSVTLAVAVVAEVPLATIELGASWSVTLAAGPVWVRVAVPDTLGVTEVSVAVIVGVPTMVELVIVAV